MRFLVLCAVFALALSTAAQNSSESSDPSDSHDYPDSCGSSDSPDICGSSDSSDTTEPPGPESTSANPTQFLSTPEECARPCRAGEKPKTCYYKWVIEYYVTLGEACDVRSTGCPSNKTIRLNDDCQCILADGYERAGLITANRMLPGPAMVMCLHDNVVVDIDNRVHGNAITIHWHGMFQHGYQYDDGIPYVTQCPILEGMSYRYQWQAQNSGTHFWHAHTGFHKGDGLMGPLIVREPKKTEMNSNAWDIDSIDNIIYLNDWSHGSSSNHFPGTVKRNPRQWPDNYLVNGMGRWTDPVTGYTTTTPLATFTINQGYRYRFRLINACSLACPLRMTIQGHNLTLIESDGEPLVPVVVDTITSISAERFDFVLTADREISTYWIQFRAIGECLKLKIQQLAVLRYETGPEEPPLPAPTYDAALDSGLVFNDLNVHCDDPSNLPDSLCFSQLRSAKEVPEELSKIRPDVQLYLGFAYYDYQKENAYVPGTYKTILVIAGQPTNNAVGYISNISMVFPASPLLSQREDISDDEICSSNNLPANCKGPEPCTCTHVEEIPLNSVVELILVDVAAIHHLSHPFHLHGHVFCVVGGGSKEQYNVENFTLPVIKDLDDRGLIKRQLTDPPCKDTFAVPNSGFTIVRFYANNPGYWMLHCHLEFHLATGMVTIFHVGDADDVKKPPEDFPKCGNYQPPVLKEFAN